MKIYQKNRKESKKADKTLYIFAYFVSILSKLIEYEITWFNGNGRKNKKIVMISLFKLSIFRDLSKLVKTNQSSRMIKNHGGW